MALVDEAGRPRVGATPPANQMVADLARRVGVRLPFIAARRSRRCGRSGSWCTRLAGRRAGALAAVVLATSSQWAFITRQAMTDMAFVSPMTIALAFAGAGAAPARGGARSASCRGARLRFGLSCAARDRVLRSSSRCSRLHAAAADRHSRSSCTMSVNVFGFTRAHIGAGADAALLRRVLRRRCGGARAPKNRRQLYLFSAYVLCALATLAKGPAGHRAARRWCSSSGWSSPAAGATSIASSRSRAACVLFIATAFPWYHAMLIRHGSGFWNEFIGDNYVHRAEGRHGDRGTFEYYIQYIGYGMFPWSGIVTLGGLLLGSSKLRDERPRKRGSSASRWSGSSSSSRRCRWSTPSSTTTSCRRCRRWRSWPALFLDDFLRAPSRGAAVGAWLLVAAPLTFLCGRDLAAFPPRLLWMFNYDYVNMPGTGRPWPLVSHVWRPLRVRHCRSWCSPSRRRSASAALTLRRLADAQGAPTTGADARSRRRGEPRRALALVMRAVRASRSGSASCSGRRRPTARRR